MGMKWR